LYDGILARLSHFTHAFQSVLDTPFLESQRAVDFLLSLSRLDTHPGEPRKLASSGRIRFLPFDVDSALVALRSPPHNDSR
jgi:hypothetical protein